MVSLLKMFLFYMLCYSGCTVAGSVDSDSNAEILGYDGDGQPNIISGNESLHAFDYEGYLERYGYLNTSDDAFTDPARALETFQTLNGLRVTGVLDKETVEVMKTPRCVQPDIGAEEFTASKTRRWFKNQLNWYFYNATYSQKLAVRKAFGAWSKITGLTFVVSSDSPDIVLSVQSGRHYFLPMCTGEGNYTDCSPFDGESGVLAHAFKVDEDQGCREIHFDGDELWSYNYQVTPAGYRSFLKVAIHEIGHVLGLGHSDDMDAVMYGTYRNNVFSEDDKLAASYLYPTTARAYESIPTYARSSAVSSVKVGVQRLNTTSTTITPLISKNPPTSTTTPTITTPQIVANKLTPTFSSKLSSSKFFLQNTPPSSSIGNSVPNLCNITKPLFFVTHSQRLYALSGNWVWLVDLDDFSYAAPRQVSDYVGSDYLPIRHVIMRSCGDLFIITDDNRYLILGYPTFQMLAGGELSTFGIHRSLKINALFNSFTGRFFIVSDDLTYSEFDSTFQLRIVSRGEIKNRFPGIPPGITHAFRSFNGNIWFFQNNTYFEFNEMRKKLLRAGEFEIGLLGIKCSEKQSLLSRLQKLLDEY